MRRLQSPAGLAGDVDRRSTVRRWLDMRISLSSVTPGSSGITRYGRETPSSWNSPDIVDLDDVGVSHRRENFAFLLEKLKAHGSVMSSSVLMATCRSHHSIDGPVHDTHSAFCKHLLEFVSAL